MKLSKNFSSGLAMRYIYSNLTGGIQVPGELGVTKPGLLLRLIYLLIFKVINLI